MKLTDFVVPNAILPDLQVDSKEGAIRAMVESLKDAGEIPADAVEDIVATGVLLLAMSAEM